MLNWNRIGFCTLVHWLVEDKSVTGFFIILDIGINIQYATNPS